MKTIYQTNVTASGGRQGHVASDDGLLDLDLSMPKQLGGTGRATNPEQLFGAGYAACFENAVLHVAQQKKIKLTGSKVSAQVSLGTFDDGRFQVGLEMDLDLQGINQEQAFELIQEAHRVCPYSNATRGNIDIRIKHHGEQVI